MKIEGVEAIFDSIKKTNIKEIEIKSKFTQIKIVRTDKEINESKENKKPLVKKEKTIENKTKNHFDICSPQIGFFNRYNSKTKKQYHKLRDIVKKGDIIGTIVSMHIHHEIVSPQDGKIVEFLVEQDQPIEYDQPLIRLSTEY